MRRTPTARAAISKSAHASGRRLVGALATALLWAAGLLLLAGSTWGWLAPHPNGDGHSHHIATLALLLLFGVACATAGVLWGRQSQSRRLREAVQEQQALIELADSWVWRTDAEHRLLHWRPPHCAALTDWADDQTQHQPLHERFEVLDTAPCPGALQARLAARALISELRVTRLGVPNKPVWRLRALPQFHSNGEFSGYLGTATPVSAAEQRRFDQALLSHLWAELDFAAVALQAQAGGWEVRALTKDAAQLLGLPDPNSPGRNFDSSTASGPRSSAPEPPLAWAQVLAQAPTELATALRSLNPGQRAQAGDWELSLTSLADENGQGFGQLLLIRAHQASEPAPSDPMSAADHESFIYSVSHDLRAPLRVVDGFARILKEDYGRFLDRIGNDHLDRVLAAGARMNSMIDALLALSRLQSQPLQRKPVDLSQLANYILEDLQREAPERKATLTIEPGLMVQGDPTLLRIAMENLLSNAWKYSGQCEHTEIEFRSAAADPAHGQSRVFVVADKGAGFDMRFADRLFGVFQRLHSPKDFQGTGVGLASVRRILRRHGGDIWAESEVGKGARFYFTLN